MCTRSMLVIAATASLQMACETPRMGEIPPERRDDVLISPQNMRTGLAAADVVGGVINSRIQVAVPDSFGNFERDELPRWDGALRLVRWPDGELVPGEWQLGLERGRYTFDFRAEAETYEEGWYAVQIDFGAVGEHRGPLLRGELQVIDGWTTNRFRIGSQPIVRLYGTLTPAAYGSALLFQTTEILGLSADRSFSEYVDVYVDGEEHPCRPPPNDVYGPERGFQGCDLECDPVREGALIEVRLRDGFFDVPVWDYSGQSPPFWTFREGEASDYGPSDAVFTVDVEERP